jgi:Zn ribbon nucleic-acid-binding protein
MGSVISNVSCPRCESEECFQDFYYKTDEIYISCPDCGYHKSFFWKRDENGELIKKDKTKGFEFDNLVFEEIHYEEPFGSYRIKFRDSAGSMNGTLVTSEDCDNLIKEIAIQNVSDKSVESFVISRYIDGKIVVENII